MQVGDSAQGREIRRSLHVTCLRWAHSQGIIHADGMSSDSVSTVRETKVWLKEQGENKEAFSIHFISEDGSNKASSADAECKEILSVGKYSCWI